MDLLTIFLGSVYAALILAALAYVSYMIGLIRVLRRIDKLSWQAFIPILNYYASVRAVGAPKKWFFLCLVPYIGAVYAGSVAIRLGEVFGKRATFSLFWLTIGSPIGTHIIARSPTVDKKLLNTPIKLLDVRSIRQSMQRNKEKTPDYK